MQISYDPDVMWCCTFATCVLKFSPMQLGLTWMHCGIQVLTFD